MTLIVMAANMALVYFLILEEAEERSEFLTIPVAIAATRVIAPILLAQVSAFFCTLNILLLHAVAIFFQIVDGCASCRRATRHQRDDQRFSKLFYRTMTLRMVSPPCRAPCRSCRPFA